MAAGHKANEGATGLGSLPNQNGRRRHGGPAPRPHRQPAERRVRPSADLLPLHRQLQRLVRASRRRAARRPGHVTGQARHNAPAGRDQPAGESAPSAGQRERRAAPPTAAFAEPDGQPTVDPHRGQRCMFAEYSYLRMLFKHKFFGFEN